MNAKHILHYLIIPWVLVLAGFLPTIAQPISYKIERDAAGTYRVYMRSTTSSSTSTVFLGTSQVTIVAPTGTFTTPTVASNIGLWSANSRINGPTITGAQIAGSSVANTYTGLDFISIGVGPGAVVAGGIVAGREYLLFSFATSGACNPAVRLWQPGDPDILQVNGSSTSTVINQISANGMGSSGSLYANNYGTNPPPCAVPDLTPGVGPVPALAVGQTVNLPVSLSNIGNASSNGTLTMTTTLPATFTAPATFSNNGWNCTTTGNLVNCINPLVLTVGSVSAYTIPMTALPAALSTTPMFTAMVSTTLDGNSTNNTASATGPLVTTAAASGAPDLISVMGPVPSLTVGVPANIPVSVSNVGTASAAGPISFATTLPASVTAAAFFTNNGWACSTTGQLVNCQTSGPLTAGSSTAFVIPVTPVTAGVTPSFTGTPATPTPESTTANNNSPSVVAPAPIAPAAVAGGPDLITAMGPIPSLTVGVPASIPVSVSNVGTASAAGPITFVTVLPASVTAASFFVSNGWACAVTSQTVSCQTSNALLAGSNTAFAIPVMPVTAGAIPVFTGTVSMPTAEVSTSNNTSTPVAPSSAIAPAAVAGAPDLISAMGPIPALTLGVSANIPVSVSNVGTASAAGPITFATTLPASVTAPAFFVNNGWACSTSGQLVNCQTAGPLSSGSSTAFTIPVTPVTAGVTPSFTGTPTTPTPEATTGNNPSPSVAASAPIAGSGGGSGTACVPCSATGVKYGIKLGIDGVTYTVYMISSETHAGNLARISTAQATIKLPRPMGIANVTSLQPGTLWSPQRVSPSETPTLDYISFGYSQTPIGAAFPITAGTEIPLFSFQRTNPSCLGTVALWSGYSVTANVTSSVSPDPFQGASTNTVPGNQMTILGAGAPNAWQCNYVCEAVCPNNQFTLIKQAPATVLQNTPYSYTFTVTNIGVTASAIPVIVTDVLAAGLLPISGGGNGWVCGVVGQTVSCTFTGSIPAPGSSSFSLLVNPTQVTNLANTATLIGGGSPNPVPSQPCAACPAGPTNTTIGASSSDLVLAMNWGGALLAGQGTVLNTTVTNAAAGLATGPLSVSIAIPAGMMAPSGAFLVAGGWSCVTSGTLISCTNPASLSAGQSLALPLALTPGATLINNPILVTGQVGVLANELSSANNFNFVYGTVLGADLSISFGAMPVLTSGQNTFLPITITNSGQASAPGNLTLAVSLPAGVSLNNSIALSAGWVVLGSSAGPGGSTVVQLMYATSGGFGSGAQLALNLPISVGVGATGSLPFSTTVVLNPFEIVVINNVATANSTVIGAVDLSVTVSGPSPALVVGQQSNVFVTILNGSNQPAAGPFVTTLVLPAGYTYSPSTLTPGWSIGSTLSGPSGTTLVLNNGSASLPSLSSLSISLGITPPLTSSGVNGSIIAVVSPVSGEVILVNNTSILYVTPSAPGIVVNTIMPPSFTAGQASNITLLFTNTGGSSYTGPISTTITLPAGTLPGALPVGWSYGTAIVNGNGTIAYPILGPIVMLPVGGNTSVSFPVTPPTTAGGSSLTILVTTSSIPSVPSSNITVTQIVPVVATPAPNLLVTVTSPSPTWSVGQPTFININLTNSGTGAVNGPTNLTISLPAGVQLSPAQLPAGWVINSSMNGPNGTIIYFLSKPDLFVGGNGGTSTVQFPVVIGQVASGSSSLTINVNILPPLSQTSSSSSLVIGPSVGAPNMVLIVGQPAPSLVVGQISFIPVSFSNTGTGAAFGPLSIQLVLPAGVTLNGSALNLPAGWVLSSTALQGGSVVATFINANSSAGGFPAGGSFLLNLPVVPSITTLNTQPGFTINLLPVGGQTTTITQQIIANPPVQNLGTPDLIILGGQPSPGLAVGQQSSIPITIQNIGSAATSGALSFQISLPTGMSLNSVQLPAGWAVSGISAILGGSVYTITNNSLSLAASGGSTVVNVPVIPGASLANATMSLSLYAMPVSGEVVVVNNTNTLNISSQVQPLPTPDLAVSIPSGQSFALAVGQTSLISFNVSNIGSASAAAPLTLQFTMPVGFSTSAASFATAGWQCQTAGNVVTCSNVNGLGINASSAITIPALPLSGAAGLINPTFQINVFGATGETVLMNNIGTINYGGIVSGPDLAVSFPAQSFTLVGGQVSNVQIQVQNLSTSATAFGPLSLTFAMPGGGFFSTSPASFLTNGWSCNTTGSIVSCLYGGSLSGSASTLLTIPLMPSASAGGVVLNPSFVAFVAGVAGELNLINNQSTLQYNGLVQSLGVQLAVKGILQGGVINGTTLMRDRLRQLGLIPLTQPYLSAGVVGSPTFTLPSTVANLATNAGVLAVTGNNAIVDWVVVELRSSTNASLLVSALPALIQVDGDVVSATDGVSPLTFAGVAPGSYYVTLRHRNHLALRSAQPVTLSTSLTPYDFTIPANSYTNTALGTRPAYIDLASGKAMLWAGNTNGDGQVIFQGSGSDVDPIFSLILFTQITNPLANFVVTQYTMSDVNLDGQVIFQGQDNEVDLLFFDVMTHPDNGAFLANFIIYQHY